MAEKKEPKMYTCIKCHRAMDANAFYTYKDGTKMEMCKKCLTMHVDPFDEDTFLWILQKVDIPYIPQEWTILRDRTLATDPHKANAGMSIFGKYFGVMKLKQYRPYGYADSAQATRDFNNGQDPDEIAPPDPEFEAEMRRKLDAGEISQAQYDTLVSTETRYREAPSTPNVALDPATAIFYNEDNYMKQEDIPDPSVDLTDEDKEYLVLKWGRYYTPAEWVELERHYQEMTDSFDIQDADTIETLKFICKVNLKMNQAIDCGDVDGFQKLSRTYDSLRKSAKFTAAQNKEEKSDFVDSVGELVAMCEKQGFIPRYATDIPQDTVDATLKDMNDYIYKLVTQDLGFGHQIEDALKNIQYQKEMDEADTRRQENGEDYEELEDADFTDFYAEVEEERAEDLAAEESDD